MAGDWMKVEKATPNKKKMRNIARICGVSRHEAFGAWFDLMCWFDGETADGHVDEHSPEDCDEIGGLPGLGRAMEVVGWLEFTSDGGTIVRNWDEHNGASAKKRGLTNRRVAMLRGRTAQRVCNAGSVTEQ